MVNRLDSNLISVYAITSDNSCLILSIKKAAKTTKNVYARMELDSHDDSTDAERIAMLCSTHLDNLVYLLTEIITPQLKMCR